MADRRLDQLDPLAGPLAGADQLLVSDASQTDGALKTRRVPVSTVLDARGYRPGPIQNAFAGADLAAAEAARDAYQAANNDWLEKYVENLSARPRFAVKLIPAAGAVVWQELASGAAAGQVTERTFFVADNTDDLIYRVSRPAPQVAWTHPAAVATSPRALAVWSR